MISAAETHRGTFNFSERHPRRLAIIMLISRPGSRIAPRPTHPNAVDKVATNILRSPEPSPMTKNRATTLNALDFIYSSSSPLFPRRRCGGGGGGGGMTVLTGGFIVFWFPGI